MNRGTEFHTCCSRKGFVIPWLVLMVLTMSSIIYAGKSTALDLGPDFDHEQTNFSLDFVHALANCESCHVQGIFIGTPRRCVDCHSNSGRIKASAPSSRHIRITGDCDFCHTPTLWTNIARVDHSAVLGSCGSCHNTVIATGKTPGHVQSSNICDDCHQSTFGWKFFHVEISSNCNHCHNGTVSAGKSPGHILSAVSCEDCHSTSRWAPETRVDHGSVFGTCFSCHNGVIARGKPAQHISSSNDCTLCHSVMGWIPAEP